MSTLPSACRTALRSVPNTQAVSTKGPRRPTNMVAMIHNCDGPERSGVTPVDRPTVPKADICSKNRSMTPERSMLWKRMSRSTPRKFQPCLLYTSDAADEEDSVDLGGRRIIKKKKNT